MFLPIKLICDRRSRRDGTNVISIQFCFSSERRTCLFTGLSIPLKYWNKKTACISKDLPGNFGDAEKMNMQLLRMRRAAENIVHFANEKKIQDPISFLKKVFHPKIDYANLAADLDRAALNLTD